MNDFDATYDHLLKVSADTIQRQHRTIQQLESEMRVMVLDNKAHFERMSKALKKAELSRKRLQKVRFFHRPAKPNHECMDVQCVLCEKPECKTCKRDYPCPTVLACLIDEDE